MELEREAGVAFSFLRFICGSEYLAVFEWMSLRLRWDGGMISIGMI